MTDLMAATSPRQPWDLACPRFPHTSARSAAEPRTPRTHPPVPGKAAPRRPVRFGKGAKQVFQRNLLGQIAATHPRALGPAPKYPPPSSSRSKRPSASVLSGTEGQDTKALPQNQYPLETQKSQCYIHQALQKNRSEGGKQKNPFHG